MFWKSNPAYFPPSLITTAFLNHLDSHLHLHNLAKDLSTDPVEFVKSRKEKMSQIVGQAWKRYLELLDTHPIRTKVGLLYSVVSVSMFFVWGVS